MIFYSNSSWGPLKFPIKMIVGISTLQYLRILVKYCNFNFLNLYMMSGLAPGAHGNFLGKNTPLDFLEIKILLTPPQVMLNSEKLLTFEIQGEHGCQHFLTSDESSSYFRGFFNWTIQLSDSVGQFKYLTSPILVSSPYSKMAQISFFISPCLH